MNHPAWWDDKALEVARQFTPDYSPQLRAELQLAVLAAMRSASNADENTETWRARYLVASKQVDACLIKEMHLRADIAAANERGDAWRYRVDADTDAICGADKALRSIAEGNLGEQPWQAGFERIRQFAADASAELQKVMTMSERSR